MFYDVTSDEGRVRLLIDDTQDPALFTGEEIGEVLDLNQGSVLRAAAQLLLLIAGSEARLSKKVTTQDLATDGPAVAAELRAQAAALRKQADDQHAAKPRCAERQDEAGVGTEAREEIGCAEAEKAKGEQGKRMGAHESHHRAGCR